MIFVLSEESFFITITTRDYWLLLFIPKTVASMGVDVDVKGTM